MSSFAIWPLDGVIDTVHCRLSLQLFTPNYIINPDNVLHLGF